MKNSVLVMILLSGVALGQDKPRVFVQGKGSQDVTTTGAASGGHHWGAWGANSTIDSHDEGMEVSKDLQKECSGVTVTLNQSAADYTVMLNRESKHNRGLLRTNSQIQVANRLGDVLGTNATRTVGNASKDACQLIMADWSQHGRLAAPDAPAPAPAAAAAPVAPAVPVAPVVSVAPAISDAPATASSLGGAKLQTVSAVQVQSSTDATAPTTVVDNGSESLGDAAKRVKQHKACSDLAKDNPSIVCK
jgi:hypothetical protein